MKKSRVSIVSVHDYTPSELRLGVHKSLELLGGLKNIVFPRSKVFIKINHLSPSTSPEKAIITHPMLTKEIILQLKDLGCNISVGDDIQSKDVDGFKISGYRKMCDQLGVKLINLKEAGFKEVECRGGQVLKKVYISPIALEADTIINLPKLKTHSYTVFTGAVKNMYGVIPYGHRLEYHKSYFLPEAFGQMLADIFSLVQPRLTIMDGILAMEGEGPSAGQPRRLGILLASQDSVSVDAVASSIIGQKPLSIYSSRATHERGLGIAKLEQIDIRGESIQAVEVKDFKQSAIALGLLSRKVPQFLYAYLQEKLALIPEVKTSKCETCLECVKICPLNAAKYDKKEVFIDKKLCIHCMCCHEVCRYQAIHLKQQPLGTVIRKAHGLFKRIQTFFSSKKD